MRLSCGVVFEAQGAGFRFVLRFLGWARAEITFFFTSWVAGIGHMNKFENL